MTTEPGRAGEGVQDTPPTVAEAVELLRKFVRCPLFGHSPVYDEPRKRRVSCSDEQCMNKDHVSYVQCAHVSHDVTEFIERWENGLDV